MRSELISQRLKLRQLRIFLAVGQTGSMARAAKQLVTSQSVISKTIGELEDLLGLRLVDRRTHGVELTAYGKSRTQHRHIGRRKDWCGRAGDLGRPRGR
jgi:molybdenum-dependent DNA-binding transcriptional regulator ModE